MVCPHCQKELPQNYGGRWCSFCGKNLPLIDTPLRPSSEKDLPQPPEAPTGKPKRLSSVIFFTVLLLPGLLTIFILMSKNSSSNYPLENLIWLILGSCFLSGIFTGSVLAWRTGQTPAMQFLLAFIFIPVMTSVSGMLCFLGCAIALSRS